MLTNKPTSERDIVAEARELADFLASMKEWRSRNQIRTEAALRALADEVVCLRSLDGQLDDIRECDKCDLCEDHH